MMEWGHRGHRVLAIGILMGAAKLAQAQAPMPPPLMHPPVAVAPVAPSSIVAGDQYYDASVSGLRAYVETLDHNARLYEVLDTEVSRLERRRRGAIAALVVGLAGLPVGTALTLASTTGCSDMASSCDINLWYTTGGFAAVGLGFGLFIAIRPKHHHVLNVINKHNRMNPAHPARLQLGLSQNRSVYAARQRLQIGVPYERRHDWF